MVGKLFIVSACSGAGKTTLVEGVISRLKDSYPLERVITYSSKFPRAGEQNGKDYHFLTSQEFERRIEEGFFLEWNNNYGHYYGSPRLIIDKMAQGYSFIMIVDLAGAQVLADLLPNSCFIWIKVETIEILKKRLFLRKSENIQQINKRLLLAEQEIIKKNKIDIFDFEISNEIFENSLQELQSVIINQLTKTAEIEQNKWQKSDNF